MRTTASAKIKINVTNEIAATVKTYTKSLQFCVDYAWQHKITQNFKLHYAIYNTLRERYKLPSQLVIACMRQACGMVKRAKSKPIVRRTSVRYNFNRSANLKGETLVLRLMTCRQEFELNIPECYKDYFDSWDVSESLLRMDKNGRCFFIFTFSREVNASELNSCTQTPVLGIDLGVNNLAVTSDNKFFNSHKVKQTKRKFKHLRTKLQAIGTQSARRLLKKVSGKETRWMAWINHNISKQIVTNFDGNRIVMENLKGIRKQWRGKRVNYWISNWSFYQLQSFIEYKAIMKGKTVDKVKPNYTSQICHRCGHLGTRSGGSFSCNHCGLSNFNADLNASRNLAHPKLVERQGTVTCPYSRSDEAKGITQSAIEAELTAKSPAL